MKNTLNSRHNEKKYLRIPYPVQDTRDIRVKKDVCFTTSKNLRLELVCMFGFINCILMSKTHTFKKPTSIWWYNSGSQSIYYLYTCSIWSTYIRQFSLATQTGEQGFTLGMYWNRHIGHYGPTFGYTLHFQSINNVDRSVSCITVQNHFFEALVVYNF